MGKNQHEGNKSTKFIWLTSKIVLIQFGEVFENMLYDSSA